MYPVTLEIPLFGGITIYSYGVMVAIGFLAGILWVTYESKRLGQDPSKAMDFVFYMILAGMVGSRIFHIAISERDAFMQNPLMFFKVWQGGLVFYGGFVAAFIFGIIYTRKHKMPLLLTCDISAPAVSIGHALGRVGCLLAGCCYGRTLDAHSWYGIIFPNRPHTIAPSGVELFPTQLMEVVGEVVIFSILMLVRRYKRFDGQVMATYLVLYSILRSFNEYFRGDSVRGFLIDPWLSTSQFISIIIFAVGLYIYIKLWNRKITDGRAS